MDNSYILLMYLLILVSHKKYFATEPDSCTGIKVTYCVQESKTTVHYDLEMLKLKMTKKV